MARVTVGPGGDYDLPTGQNDWAVAIADALNDGHRWLVFPVGGFWVSQVDLDNFVNPALSVQALRLEGAAPHLTHFLRLAPSVMFRASGANAWHLYFEGIIFAGLGPDPWNRTDNVPICDFKRIRYSMFKNCSFWGSGGTDGAQGGTGLELGTGSAPPGHVHEAHSVVLLHCAMDMNRDAGLVLENASNISLVSGFVQHNCAGFAGIPNAAGRGGIHWGGGGTGGGLIMGTHFELNGPDGEWGLNLHGGRAVRLANTYIYFSRVRLDAQSQRCWIENPLEVVKPGDPEPVVDLNPNPQANRLTHPVRVTS